MLGRPIVNDALESIDMARKEYRNLAEECKKDPVLAPEALYNEAVATEALAVRNPRHLDEALRLYHSLAIAHPDSARGKQAEARAKEIEGNRPRVEVTAPTKPPSCNK